MDILLAVEGVWKTFGGVVALSDVSFTVNKGEIVGLIGPNGAGKTTLFNVIVGFYTPERGKILFKGKNITGTKPHAICKKGIARTFQVPKPFGGLTVFENMMVGASFGTGKQITTELADRVKEILSWAGLDSKAAMPANTLNLVERKKLEVARALATCPEVILLDETICGLNPAEASEMVTFIERLRSSGITIIIIEHVMRVIMDLSDRIVVLHYGKKISEGTPLEVANDPQVIDAYLGV
ncbi:MAG: ABC transporter ATP-binding protein [Deltaproteobacteria bacterium]|nr:ABC transporter ATP-binding protein [Deltaproteobacteria bacterium]HDM10138.1 ABC transporter ATP-binding protein [Desulfobacteraceae bacterium]